MARMQVYLFKDSYQSFTDSLGDEGVKFDMRVRLSEWPSAAGMGIEVIGEIAQATPWGALAIVIVAWLHARKSRKVIITMKGHKIVHAEGYSAKEIEGFLDKAESMAVIDTEPA